MNRYKRKPCKRCQGPKESGQSYKYCRACAPIARAEAIKRNREYIRLAYQQGHWKDGRPVEPIRARALRRYSLTIDDYTQMFQHQDGKCAICGAPEPNGRQQYFAIDHDHETGHIRGLLCQRCNAGLHFLENLKWREQAEQYLSCNKATKCPESLLDQATS